MKIELKEHEIEQAIETFIGSFVTGNPVKVKGFDLQGMRSKDGLSAIVDVDIVGVTDTREPKLESTNVNPTNTSWREERQEIKEKQELEGQDLDDWTEFLELITDNAKYKNYQALVDLVDSMSESLQLRASEHPLYKEMLEFTQHEPEEKETVEPEIEVEHSEALTEELEQVKQPKPKPEPEKEKEKKNIFGAQLGVKPSNIHNVGVKRLFPPKSAN
mgnify:CR=1 FL=1